MGSHSPSPPKGGADRDTILEAINGLIVRVDTIGRLGRPNDEGQEESRNFHREPIFERDIVPYE